MNSPNEANTPLEGPDRPAQKYPRPLPETLLYRAFWLRCPRCGEGKLFAKWFRMNKRCTNCDLLIDRPDGYYLGSMYINYGMTAWVTVITFMFGRLAFHLPSQTLIWPLAAFCLIFPTLFFRHARSFWLALDCQLDSNVLQEGEDDDEQHP